MSNYDILIIGGGIVGLTAALALAKKTTLTIALIDAKKLTADWQQSVNDYRVSAISLASQRIFQNLNVWSVIEAKRVSAYQKMFVWDEQGTGEIAFDNTSLGVPALGHIIEDSAMRSSLLEKLQACANVTLFSPLKLISLQDEITQMTIIAENNKIFHAKLIIAADGGNSWVREQAGISLKTRDYAHTAIVTTVQTSLPHQQTAWQRFSSSGPLAFLPLQDNNTCSIVWSTLPDVAKDLLALNDENFKTELTKAFSAKLGEITELEQRFSFPLQMRHANHYVQARLALIGDAAHTIHPLAGQGVNLGLLDAACLVDVIVTALAKKRDYASFATLRRYERWRKGDNMTMLALVAGLKQLFASETNAIKNLRSFGLNIVNRNNFLKEFLTNYAIGKRKEMPSLASIIY